MEVSFHTIALGLLLTQLFPNSPIPSRQASLRFCALYREARFWGDLFFFFFFFSPLRGVLLLSGEKKRKAGGITGRHDDERNLHLPGYNQKPSRTGSLGTNRKARTPLVKGKPRPALNPYFTALPCLPALSDTPPLSLLLRGCIANWIGYLRTLPLSPCLGCLVLPCLVRRTLLRPIHPRYTLDTSPAIPLSRCPARACVCALIHPRDARRTAGSLPADLTYLQSLLR